MDCSGFVARYCLKGGAITNKSSQVDDLQDLHPNLKQTASSIVTRLSTQDQYLADTNRNLDSRLHRGATTNLAQSELRNSWMSSRANVYNHAHSNLRFKVGLCRVYLQSVSESSDSHAETDPPLTHQSNLEKKHLERTCSNGGQSTALISSRNSLPVRSHRELCDVPESSPSKHSPLFKQFSVEVGSGCKDELALGQSNKKEGGCQLFQPNVKAWNPVSYKGTATNIQETNALTPYVLVKPDLAEQIAFICRLDLESLSGEETVRLITHEKNLSMALQKYLYTVWNSQFSRFASVVFDHLDVLATHPLGNYVLQILVLRDPNFRACVESACKANFEIWQDNEFSSRLMQTLLEISESFQYFVSNMFGYKPRNCMKSIPSVFLVMSLIRNTKDESLLQFLDQHLFENIHQALENRLMRRILVVYCERASQQSLDRIFLGLSKHIKLERILREKTLVAILQTMLVRKHEMALGLLEQLLCERLQRLLSYSFFKYLIKKCALFPQGAPRIRSVLQTTLGQSYDLELLTDEEHHELQQALEWFEVDLGLPPQQTKHYGYLQGREFSRQPASWSEVSLRDSQRAPDKGIDSDFQQNHQRKNFEYHNNRYAPKPSANNFLSGVVSGCQRHHPNNLNSEFL